MIFLILLCALQSNNIGKMRISWLPDTFRCDWLVEWEDGEVRIHSNWEYTVGHLENILNEKNRVDVLIDDFLNEWKEVLGIVIRGLEHCGYVVTPWWNSYGQ